MAERQWTKEQKRAIDLSGRNLLVSAAAGSGKTAVLVERILSLLTEGDKPLNIDELLVVTFTNAAAAEMRERIGDAIARRIETDPENDHLQKQQTLLSTAMIMTIDSFCMNVVKNYFPMIELDPSFRLGDEVEMELMQSDVLEELLERKYEEGDNRFLRFVECYGGNKSDMALETMIKQMFRASESYPWPMEWLEEQEAMYSFETMSDLLDSVWMKQLMTHTSELVESSLKKAETARMICRETEGPDSYEKAVLSDIEQLEYLRFNSDYKRMQEQLENVEFIRLSSRTKEGTSEQKKERVKELRASYKKTIKEIKEIYFFQSLEESFADLLSVQELMFELIALTKEFGTAFSKRKEERNLLDFSDIEHFALKILVDRKEGKVIPSQAAEVLREQFAQIMIDEYQDSNLVQETILTSIAREQDGQPNQFMVGDVKQSIYRFRLARPELFMEKYETYTEEDSKYQKIDLSQNFRSRHQVLNSVNYLFEWFMKKEFGRIAYDDKAALYPGRTFLYPDEPEKELENYDTELLLIGRESDDEGDSENTEEDRKENTALTPREIEAYAIAKRIKELTDKEHGLLIEGKDGLQRAGYGDITILLRSMQGWSETFTTILMSEGIPTVSETRTGFFQTMEVQTVLNYLRILDNPRQDIPAAAVLYSPIVMLTSEEMASVRDIRMPLMESVRAYAATEPVDPIKSKTLQEKLTVFLAQYDYLRRCAVHEPIHELIRTLYETTQFLYKVSFMSFGDRRRANLALLITKAKSYEETSYHGVFHFIRYVERLLSYDIDFGEAGLSKEGKQAVRIMSIHKSKGLEFPVVFVAGMGKKFNMRDLAGTVVIHPELGIGPECIDEIKRTRITSLPKAVIRKGLQKESIAEELRVLYVALTRAREKLIMTGTIKEPEETVKGWINAQSSEVMDSFDLEKAGSYLSVVGPSMFRSIDDAEALQECYIDVVPKATKQKVRLKAKIEPSIQMEEILLEQKEEVDKKQRLLESLKECRKQSDIDEQSYNSMPAESTMTKDHKGEKEEVFTAGGTSFDKQEYQEYVKRLTFLYPYEEAAKLPMKVSVSELKHRAMDDLEEAVVLLSPEKEKTLPAFLLKSQENKTETISGSARGTLYHTIMENLPLQSTKNALDLSAFLDIIEENGKITKEERKALKTDHFVKFLENPLAERMKRAEEENRLFREQPFVIGVEDEQAEGEYLLIQGIIDCFFEEDGQLVLVDYKTDQIPKDGALILKNRYQVQMDYYSQALEQCMQKKVKEKILYSFALSCTIEW